MGEKQVEFVSDILDLTGKARMVRHLTLKSINKAKSGHPGGSLSCIDILVAISAVKRPIDKLVLSKGHAAPALYALLAVEGKIPIEELDTLRHCDARLQGHQEMVCPGVDAGYGSLGHGLSIANGMALGARLSQTGGKVFAVLGDGECNEGQVWEAVASAAHFKLNNVIALIDVNGLQLDGHTAGIKQMRLADNFRSFGWQVIEVNGHDLTELSNALATKSDKPIAIVCYTVKGKGSKTLETNAGLHSAGLSDENLSKALEELEDEGS